MDDVKIKLDTLVQRLFVIDSKLTGETSQLVSEYNQIVEEIYMILGEVLQKDTPSKVLKLSKGEKM